MSSHNMFSWRNKKDQHFSDEKSALSVAMIEIGLIQYIVWEILFSLQCVKFKEYDELRSPSISGKYKSNCSNKKNVILFCVAFHSEVIKRVGIDRVNGESIIINNLELWMY